MKRNVFGSDSSDEEVFVKKAKPLKLGESNAVGYGDSLVKEDQPGLKKEGEGTIAEDLDSLEDMERQSFQVESLYPSKSSLYTPLSTNSIGMMMMQKMGYNLGDALGSGETRASSMTEPLAIRVKTDRKGIGATHGVLPHVKSGSTQEYRLTSKNKQVLARNKRYLRQLQKFCFHESGDDELLADDPDRLQEVNEMWREWAEELLGKSQRRTLLFGEEIPEQEADEPLKSNLVDSDEDGLRRLAAEETKLKCFSAEQVQPEEHTTAEKPSGYHDINAGKTTKGVDSPSLEASLGEPNYEDDSLTSRTGKEDDVVTTSATDEDHLSRILAHCRQVYFYCPYCGVRYEDEADLQENCPGDYDDHAW